MKNIANTLQGKTIRRLFLIAFPPWAEKLRGDIDIRIGFELLESSGKMFVLGTDLEDMWSPKLSFEELPASFFDESQFSIRMERYMNEQIEESYGLEYYDFTHSSLFADIANNKIVDVQLIREKNCPEPFGIKLVFQKDYLLSFPNATGNTLRSKMFNQFGSLKHFESLGKVIFEQIS